jgi:hypothetical protein
MPLICQAGFHSANRYPKWSNGFYLSTCKRCGSGLIRTAFESWRVSMPAGPARDRLTATGKHNALRRSKAAWAAAIGGSAVAIAAMSLPRQPAATVSHELQLVSPSKQLAAKAPAPVQALPPPPLRQNEEHVASPPKLNRTAAKKINPESVIPPRKFKQAGVSPPAAKPGPAKPVIRYKFSANMKLFCKGAGRLTPECRTFRRNTARRT